MGRDARLNPRSFESQQRPQVLLDRFGRELQVGDLVVADQKGPMLYRVETIAPNLGPGAANTLRVTLAAVAQVILMAAEPVIDLMMVLPAPEKPAEQTKPSEEKTDGQAAAADQPGQREVETPPVSEGVRGGDVNDRPPPRLVLPSDVDR